MLYKIDNICGTFFLAMRKLGALPWGSNEYLNFFYHFKLHERWHWISWSRLRIQNWVIVAHHLSFCSTVRAHNDKRKLDNCS